MSLANTLPREGSRVQSTTMNQPPQGQQSLVKTGSVALDTTQVPMDPVSDWRVYQGQLDALRENFNLVAPPVYGRFAPGFTIVPSIVQIDATVVLAGKSGVGKETYFSPFFMKAGGKSRDDMHAEDADRALGRVALDKICMAAGIEWDLDHTGRTDERTEPNLWQYRAVGYVLCPDAQKVPLIGETEIDLRSSSPQVRGFSDSQVIGARAHGLKLAATKARQVAIRRLGLQQTYTVAELKKPFLIYRTIFTPDLTNPEIAKLYAAHHMGMAATAKALLYPASPVNETALPEPQPPAGTLEAEVGTTSSEAPPVATRTTPKPLLIVAVNDIATLQTGEVVVEIVTSDGTKARTLNAGIATQTRAWMKNREPIDTFDIEPSPTAPGKYRVVEIVPVRAVESDDDKY